MTRPRQRSSAGTSRSGRRRRRPRGRYLSHPNQAEDGRGGKNDRRGQPVGGRKQGVGRGQSRTGAIRPLVAPTLQFLERRRVGRAATLGLALAPPRLHAVAVSRERLGRDHLADLNVALPGVLRAVLRLLATGGTVVRTPGTPPLDALLVPHVHHPRGGVERAEFSPVAALSAVLGVLVAARGVGARLVRHVRHPGEGVLPAVLPLPAPGHPVGGLLGARGMRADLVGHVHRPLRRVLRAVLPHLLRGGCGINRDSEADFTTRCWGF